MSDFTNLTSNGVPVFGMITSGKSFFVDPARGSDSNTGERMDRALQSIATAYSLCRDGYNDVIYYLGGSTSATSLTEGLVWSKSYTHLVGICAPTRIAKRSRCFADATTMPTMLTVSGSGCIFKDLYFFHGLNDASSLVCANVTGGRNYFENVHFAGIGHAAMDVAGACSLKLDGAAENTFKNCTIGIDTIARGADSSEVLVDGSSARNVFEDCMFNAYIDDVGHSMIKLADASAIDRYLIFKNCLFLFESLDNGTSATEVINTAAAPETSYIVLQDSMYVGASAWDGTGVAKIYNNTPAAAASAAGGAATNL